MLFNHIRHVWSWTSLRTSERQKNLCYQFHRNPQWEATFIAGWWFNRYVFASKNIVPFCLCYLPPFPIAASNMNFDLSEITELVKNQNKTLDTFFAPHYVQKNESQPWLKAYTLVGLYMYTCSMHGVFTKTCFLSDSFIYQMLALFWPMSETKHISSNTHTHRTPGIHHGFWESSYIAEIQEQQWVFTLHFVWISTVSNWFLSCLSLFLFLFQLLIFSGTIWILIFPFIAIQPDRCCAPCSVLSDTLWPHRL